MGKKTLISFSRNVNEGFCYALKVLGAESFLFKV